MKINSLFFVLFYFLKIVLRTNPKKQDSISEDIMKENGTEGNYVNCVFGHNYGPITYLHFPLFEITENSNDLKTSKRNPSLDIKLDFPKNMPDFVQKESSNEINPKNVEVNIPRPEHPTCCSPESTEIVQKLNEKTFTGEMSSKNAENIPSGTVEVETPRPEHPTCCASERSEIVQKPNEEPVSRIYCSEPLVETSLLTMQTEMPQPKHDFSREFTKPEEVQMPSEEICSQTEVTTLETVKTEMPQSVHDFSREFTKPQEDQMPSEEICSQTEATLLEKIKTKIPRYLYFESAEHQSERLERVEECSDLLLEEKEKEFTLEILSEGGYESFDEDDCQHDCISLNEDSSDSSPHAPSNVKNEPESDDFISISQPENSDELPGKNFFPSYSSF